MKPTTSCSTSIRQRIAAATVGALLLLGAMAVHHPVHAQVTTAPTGTVGGTFPAGQPAPTDEAYKNRGSAPRGSTQTNANGKYVGSDDSVVSGGALATGTPPVCTVNGAPTVIIAGQQSTVTATCSQSPSGYSWTVGGGGPAIFGAGATLTFPTPGTYTYSVIAINPWGASPASNTVTITVNPPAPVCTLTGNPLVLTVGQASTLTASCTNSPTSYTWNSVPSSGYTPAPSGAGGTLTFNSSGTYTFQVRGNNAGGSGSYSNIVSVNVVMPAPICSVTTNPAVITQGQSSTITATCANSPTSYAWQALGVAPAAPANVATTTMVFNTAGTAQFRVAGTNATGTGPYSGWATVIVNPGLPPVCTLTASPTTFIVGQTTTLTASCSNSPSIFNWSSASGASGGLSASGLGGTATPTTSANFTYQMTATNAFGTSAVASVTVTANPQVPACTISAIPSTITQGQTSTIAASCTNGATYEWTNPGGGSPTCSFSGCGGAFGTVGTYTYSVRGRNVTGVSPWVSATVTVNPAPPVSCTISASPNPIALGQSSTVTTTCAGGATNYWMSSAQGPPSGLVDGPYQARTVTPTAQGVFTFYGQANNGYNVSPVTATTLTVNPPMPSCNAGTIVTSISGALLTTQVSGLTNVTRVLFATWSDAGGQDDLQWYPTMPNAGGSASGVRGLATLDTYQVHIYVENANYTNVWCGNTVVTYNGSPPICNMSTYPSATYVGGSAGWTLSCDQPIVNSYWDAWTAPYIRADNSQYVPAGGPQVMRNYILSQQGTYGFTAYGINAAGQWSNGTYATISAAYVPPPGPPSCSLSASPNSITVNQGSTLSASCPGASSIEWSNPGGAPAFGGAGGYGTFPSQGSFTYSVRGWDGYGQVGGWASAAVSVGSGGPPPPGPVSCTLTANPSSIYVNTSSTLTANCPGAVSIRWTTPGGAPAFSGTGGTGTFGTQGSFTYAVEGFNGVSYGSPAYATVQVNASPNDRYTEPYFGPLLGCEITTVDYFSNTGVVQINSFNALGGGKGIWSYQYTRKSDAYGQYWGSPITTKTSAPAIACGGAMSVSFALDGQFSTSYSASFPY